MKQYLKILGIFCVCLAAAESLWASSTRAIVPVKRQSETFYVNVSVNHDNLIYEEGDLMEVTVTSSKDGYLYLLYQDASGNVALLFPNSFNEDNFIKANSKTMVPSKEMNFDLKTMPPFGKERLQAIVTTEKVKDSSVMNFKRNDNVKLLSQKELDSFHEKLSKGMGVFAREEASAEEETEPTGKIEMAEYFLEITTKAKNTVVEEEEAGPKRYFIGIAVAKYQDKTIPALPACELDLEAVGKFFNANTTVDNYNSWIYINEDVTMTKIRELFFERLPSLIKPGDEIIIYWTGHGGRCSNTNGDEADGFDETLILYDSKRLDAETQLRDDEFGRWVQNLNKCKVFFILDTCHSAGLSNYAKNLTNEPTTEWDFGFGECAQIKDIGQSNLSLMASSAKSEVSVVRPDQSMSVMTWYMMEELKNTKRLTHKQLYLNIKDKVHKYAHDRYNIEQNVYLHDDFESPMVLNP